MPMGPYQQEQLDALLMIQQHLRELSAAAASELQAMISDYLDYRSRVAEFLGAHFNGICTEKCYTSRRSACCSRDGIITFFGDVAVNALVSDKQDLHRLEQAIKNPADPAKCIYLSDAGCLFRLKPIVCELFLCDEAEHKVLDQNPAVSKAWEAYKQEKKRFTWPDQPVLFEMLEAFFINRGSTSPLMYIHNSPGLLRIKNNREKFIRESQKDGKP